MSILPEERLIELLCQIPALQEYENRSLLLENLPADPFSNMPRYTGMRADITNIVMSAKSRGWIEERKQRAIVIVRDNAIAFARDTSMEAELLVLPLDQAATTPFQAIQTHTTQTPDWRNVDPVKLREAILSLYTRSSFEILCLDMGTRYDLVEGNNLPLKVANLIKKMRGKRRYEELVRRVLYDYPGIADALTA